MSVPLASDPDSPSAPLLIAAQTLALDAHTGEVARALQSADVRAILLKGPTVARWLYDQGDLRGYVDIDLLVSKGDWIMATNVLRDSGFEPSGAEVALPYGRRPHAETWIRERDGLMVDLHSTLPGVGVSRESAWTVLSANTLSTTVGGVELETLSESGRALLVVLHAAHHGCRNTQAMSDLTRALARVADPTWHVAVALAQRLDAVPALAVGLRLLPRGIRLAGALELPVASSTETILRANSAPELALSFDWLMRTPGFGARSRLILRRLVPAVSVLRGRSKLARRGCVGLLASYALQPFWLSLQATPALRAWLSARKETERMP